MNKQLFIAMSLTSNLKAVVNYYEIGKVTSQKIKSITGYSTEKIEGFEYLIKVGYGTDIEFRKEVSVLPILYPLPDLIKSRVKGELPRIQILKEMNDGDDIYISEFGVSIDNGYAAGYNLRIAYEFIHKLIEWHFDIAGLIEKGEAIDVNTLEINPYL